MKSFYLKAADFVQNRLPSCEYFHALSVAHYVQKRMISDGWNSSTVNFVSGLAMLHDYLEYHGVNLVNESPALKEFLNRQSQTLEKFGFSVRDAEEILERLTRRQDEEYSIYIQRCILDCAFIKNAKYAYIIKQADMKDHFFREETLTNALRQKYEPHLKYFLE